ncbi:MAG: CDP-diacylglycerol--serine O-phosphatidyltransferase [Ignavibacterium sp.]
MRRLFPNFFTTLNIFCGFLSIIWSMNGNYVFASWLIIFAALFDAFDGIAARLTHTSSQFGVELDSLADAISFGVAPAFLIYSVQFYNYQMFGIILSFIFLFGCVFRLARFNSQLVGFEKEMFYGLPTPSAAITLASFIFLFYKDGHLSSNVESFSIPLVIILSLLMASKIKYDILPKFSLEGVKEKPYHFVFIFTSIILIIFTKGKALFFIFLFVILLGIFREIFSRMFSQQNKIKTYKSS